MELNIFYINSHVQKVMRKNQYLVNLLNIIVCNIQVGCTLWDLCLNTLEEIYIWHDIYTFFFLPLMGN